MLIIATLTHCDEVIGSGDARDSIEVPIVSRTLFPLVVEDGTD